MAAVHVSNSMPRSAKGIEIVSGNVTATEKEKGKEIAYVNVNVNVKGNENENGKENENEKEREREREKGRENDVNETDGTHVNIACFYCSLYFWLFSAIRQRSCLVLKLYFI
jgi:hypothetical protein